MCHKKSLTLAKEVDLGAHRLIGTLLESVLKNVKLLYTLYNGLKGFSVFFSNMTICCFSKLFFFILLILLPCFYTAWCPLV